MILTNLTLENFAPFYHRHELPLGIKSTASVVIIHGENMRGKTSVLNAIRWCLYGTARGRGGRVKETHRLLNYDALQEGDNHMSVKLEFEHAQHHYELERHVQAATRPRADNELEEKVYLRRSGKYLPETQIDEEIGGILHEGISRFFLFDGEMLDQFEVLLFSPGKDADLVKTSIEQILGLPALHFAVDDLDALHRIAERRQLRAVKQTKLNETLIAKAQQIEANIESLERDLGELKSRRDKVELKRAALSERRDGFAEIKADVRALEEIEQNISEHKNRAATEIGECKKTLSEAWWEPAGSIIAEILRADEAKAQQLAEGLQVAAAAEYHIKALREAARGKCPVCASSVTPEHARTLSHELKRLEGVSNTERPGAEEMVTLQHRISQLRKYATRERLRIISEKERSARRHQIDANKADRQAEEIRQRLKGHDRLEVQKVETEYEEVIATLSSLRKDIESREIDLARQKELLSSFQQEIAKLPEAKPRIVTEAAVYESLREIFRHSIDGFRDHLRKDVEAEATNIFRALTTETDYARLVINDQYGLSIVDRDNVAIRDRSAGAEQIVALSLIGALNHCAIREGPVVMDTPFGRLDIKHRGNVLAFVPRLAPQVVLLVQSGEFDRERDLQYLKSTVSLECRIVRDGKPTRSRFERMV